MLIKNFVLKNISPILQVVASIICFIGVLYALLGKLTVGFIFIAIFAAIVGFLMCMFEHQDAAFPKKTETILKFVYMAPSVIILILVLVFRV